ncbi:MAG: hypothetical protein FD168_779 [Desulfobulbaceae bacterium]|jgi:hypothetical protein|nr:MAG: hypothetical protein FD168_779 [Desulfobulbaceae bacterium]
MTIDSQDICFGLNEELDRKSISCFLQLAGRPEFAEILSQRLSEDEIHSFVNFFTGLLKRNLSQDEYHSVFLQKEHSHDHSSEETS